MNAWIETAAGNLLSFSSGAIVVKESTPGGPWEIGVAVGAAPSPFATGLADRPAADRVRNALAIRISTVCTGDAPQIIRYNAATGTVCATDLD